MKFAEIPVREIVHSRYSGENTRIYDSETFAGLSKSVKMMGVNTPIVVTDRNENGMYMVIDGDHRLEAAKAAGLLCRTKNRGYADGRRYWSLRWKMQSFSRAPVNLLWDSNRSAV